METQMLKINDAARIAGIGRSAAYDFVTRGDWPSVKLGRSLRVPLKGLKSWLADREREAEERAAALRGGE